MHDTDRIAMENIGMAYDTSEYDETFAYEGGEVDQSTEGVFDEVDEIDLASQMLEITEEDELDYFLGNLFKKAAGAVGGLLKTPIGQQLGGLLKGAVRKYVPMAGAALGGRIGGATGARIGRQLASGLANMAGESAEVDQEFAAARRFVRMAGSAAAKAAKATGVDPRAIARKALVEAANRFLPGLFGETGEVAAPAAAQGAMRTAGGQSGRWVRRGTRIVLLGV